MGYSIAMTTLIILLSPLILICVLVGIILGKWLRFLPEQVPILINFSLISSFIVGSLFFYGTAEMLLVMPDRLQRDYLGANYASVFDLRQFYHQPHLQDPSSEWRYALGSDEAAVLRRRCRYRPLGEGGRECVLFSGMDDRWFATVTLSEANELRIEDGLW